MDKIKVILVDDHNVVRDGIKSLILSDDNIEVIGEASSYIELMKILKYSIPDVLILDISLPDKSGIEIAKELSNNDIAIMILSMYTDEEFVLNAVKAGAKAYLPKNTTKKELIEAIKTINDDGEYFGDKISGILMKSFMKSIKNLSESENKESELSKRESEILKLYAEGKSNSDIADKLFISVRTVESHKNHIMNKLKLKSTVDLVKYAIKQNIISI